MSYESELLRLQAGKTTFTQFAQATKRDREHLGRKLLRDRIVPAGVDEEDLAQEILLWSWRYLPKHQPERAALGPYITWNSMQRARRWMSQQSGQRDGAGDPRVALPMSSVPLHRREEVSDAPSPDFFDAVALVRAAVEALPTALDRACAEALISVGGHIGPAAELVLDDARLGIRTRNEARREVRRIETALAEFIGGSE